MGELYISPELEYRRRARQAKLPRQVGGPRAAGDPRVTADQARNASWPLAAELAPNRLVTNGAKVLSNDPKNDPRSGGVPFGHGKIKSYLGLPFLVEEELVGAVALANRADGYRWSDVDLLIPLCRVAGLLIADCRSSR